MSSSGEEENQPRGKYQPSIIGFLLEYQADVPLSPWAYSSLVPDRVLSYSSDTHFDLVILRFGRTEKRFNVLLDALNSLQCIRVQDITVFKNSKNANRLHYLRRVIFPRMGSFYHHSMREWSLKDCAKQFVGMDTFLKYMVENDITLSEVKAWTNTQCRKARRTLSKYNLEFIT
jgi:hypothetical protein